MENVTKKKPDDYVISTGLTYSVRDFVNECCRHLGIKIKWIGKNDKCKGINLKNKKTIIKVKKKFYRPAEVDYLRGNHSKAKKILKWKVKTNFKKLVEIMLTADLDRVQKSL